MNSYEIEAMSERVAELASERTVKKLFTSFGVDAENPIEMQRDFAFVRSFRKNVTRAITTAITVVVTAVIGLFVSHK